MERELLRRLCALCTPALEVESAAYGALHPHGDFTEWMGRGGLLDLLERLPVLAGLVETVVEQWAAAAAELLERLAADRRLLRRELAGGAPLGRVTSVEWGLSDPHREGRTVAVVEFASGLRVVYKPRGLGIDAAWQRLLAWLGERDPACRLRTLRVLDRGTHGWMEWAEPTGPLEEAGYHERLGALLCLAYVFGGGDLHPGNVLRCGADPVLVDAEVMLGAPPAHPADPSAVQRAAWASVVRTHLLPGWRARPRAWPGDERHLEALLAGFERAYRTLVRCREALTAADGPLEELARRETRVVLRDTRRYATLLERMLHPRYLCSETAWAAGIDALAAPLLRAERRDLARMDVPVFTARGDGTRVRDSEGREVGDLRAGTGLEEAVRRIRGMDTDDLDVQKQLIRLGLAPPRAVPPGDGTGRGGDDALMSAVRTIADGLRATALPARDGVSWVGVLGHPPRFGRLDASLEHGNGGIALFLAALARATGSRADRDFALRAASKVLRGIPLLLDEPGEPDEPGLGRLAPNAPEALEDLAQAPLGRFDPPLRGNLGTVEALLVGSERLGRPELRDAALRLANEVVQRAARRGSFATGTRDVLTPGFMEGVSGIGYGLLRLRFPGLLPSVLFRE